MFDADEIDELARRGRPRRSGGGGLAGLVIESALTEITSTTRRYRGCDATDLALRCTFDDVAMLLWIGSLPAGRPGLPRGTGPTAEGHRPDGRGALAWRPRGTGLVAEGHRPDGRGALAWWPRGTGPRAAS